MGPSSSPGCVGSGVLDNLDVHGVIGLKVGGSSDRVEDLVPL